MPGQIRQGGKQLDRPQRTANQWSRETIPPSETDDGNFWECRAYGLSAKANVIGEGTEQVQPMNSPRS